MHKTTHAMKIDRAQLLTELQHITDANIAAATHLQTGSAQALNAQPSENAWSALECLEHLNRYGDFYLPEIEQRMLKAPASDKGATFKAGLLGNYFANRMRLVNGQSKPMKTLKNMNPAGSNLSPLVLERFLKQQHQLKKLLQQAGSQDLTRTKTSISISTVIKLRLGDTFRVVIYHNERHMAQALRALEAATATH